MVIRKTRIEELDEVMCIYARAAEYMAQTGNPNQWGNGYPSRELIVADIQHGASYVADVNGSIEAVFMYFEGADPTYARIDNGAWHVSGPYAVLHRIASAGRVRGIGRQCIAWCAAQASSHGCSSLRADTHMDNKVMQYVLQKSGFFYCGVVYLQDGAPRLAYERPLGQNYAQGNTYAATDSSYYVKQKGDGIAFGVASMVLGIISLLLFCTCANFLTGILATIFGIIQLTQHKEKLFAITGIVTAAISIVLGIFLWLTLAAGMADTARGGYDDIYDYYYGDEFYDDIYDGDYRDDYYDGYDYYDYFDYYDEESGAEFL